MAVIYTVLGQEAPGATTPTNIYTVPSNRSAIISSLVVANRGSTSATYRISVRPAGVTQADKHYLVYDATLSGNTTTALTLGITLAGTDVITVYASTATFSFAAFGSEIV